MLRMVCLAGILCIATLTDLLFRKVPNALILPGLALGILLSFPTFGGTGILPALSGAALPLLLLPLFMMGCMGAGDIKLLMVVGCMVGPAALPELLLRMLGVAALFCIPTLVRWAGDCGRVFRMAGHPARSRQKCGVERSAWFRQKCRMEHLRGLWLRLQARAPWIPGGETATGEKHAAAGEKRAAKGHMIPLAPAMLLGFVLWSIKGGMAG